MGMDTMFLARMVGCGDPHRTRRRELLADQCSRALNPRDVGEFFARDHWIDHSFDCDYICHWRKTGMALGK